MCYLSFFQFFSDFPLKNRVKFDSFSLFFEFHHSLFMHFSDAEIPIVNWWSNSAVSTTTTNADLSFDYQRFPESCGRGRGKNEYYPTELSMPRMP